MADAAAQRVNMVDSQVRPSDVTDRRVIRAMLQVPREEFVPAAQRTLAYADGDLDIGGGRMLLAPRVMAKLLQLAAVNAGDSALVIGGAPGYAAALLESLGAKVVALSEGAGSTGGSAVQHVAGTLSKGHSASGPYDIIFVDGGVAEVPQALKDQLKDGGRLVTILMDGKTGRASLLQRTGSGFAEASAFDATARILPGFEAASPFAL